VLRTDDKLVAAQSADREGGIERREFVQ